MSGWLSQAETRNLAMNVARLRAQRSWTQEELAIRSGLHVSTLRHLNRGGHGAQDRTLQALATAFGVPDSDDLLAPWDPLPVDPDPVGLAQTAFNHQVEDLKRIVARTARSDPAAGERLYSLLTGRVRQMTQAVQAERRAAQRNGSGND